MKDLAKIVKDILIRNEKARNSDYSLYIEVCKVKCPKVLNDGFLWVLEHHNELGVPKFESVGRARRKIQELYPELRSCEEVQKEKNKKEEEFRNFAFTKNL